MSDRCHSLIVVLQRDLRTEDDAQPIIQAILQLKGVVSVKPGAADCVSFMAEERARAELGQKLLEIVYPKIK